MPSKEWFLVVLKVNVLPLLCHSHIAFGPFQCHVYPFRFTSFLPLLKLFIQKLNLSRWVPLPLPLPLHKKWKKILADITNIQLLKILKISLPWSWLEYPKILGNSIREDTVILSGPPGRTPCCRCSLWSPPPPHFFWPLIHSLCSELLIGTSTSRDWALIPFVVKFNWMKPLEY